jgi:hypothetical protein
VAEILEWTAEGDAYRDYCLWDYTPPAPTAGKLRQASLLWHSFDVLGAPPALRRMVEALRAELGPFRISWGVKRIGDRFSWELYFYDYARLERTVSIERVLGALSPFAPSRLSLSGARPYFMFSVDLDHELGEGRRGIDEISVYIGNPGSSVSSGISYQLSAEELRLGNLYYFFDAEADVEDIIAKVACSSHLDLAGLPIDQILWPELRRCGVIVVANKRYNDGVYFSRITIDQLIGFLDRLDYPAPLRAFLGAHRDRLDHLLYDVGIDYRMVDGRIEVVKSAYYGLV